MTQATPGDKKPAFVTTDTGRVLRVDQLAQTPRPPAPSAARTHDARREDVLFRVRREQGHEVSPWWNIGAFLGVSIAVVLLLGWVPGGA